MHETYLDYNFSMLHSVVSPTVLTYMHTLNVQCTFWWRVLSHGAMEEDFACCCKVICYSADGLVYKVKWKKTMQ